MRNGLALAAVVVGLWTPASLADGAKPAPMPVVPQGWKIELVKEAPEIVFPTAVVCAPDGTIYLGQDPMDMPGPPTVPIDSVVAIKDGKVRVFADKLWAVMGLEWVDDTLYVVHAPFLSALKDTDGDGKADKRVDLITGLGPKLPGFNGINDHVASGVRLGMDGFLYISVGDKGIPKGVGKDGTTIQLFGGGVIRIRPDGTGLEVVSQGERNPLSVALSTTDEIFTYGNDDDSKKWPNSLTHHIVGADFGYPYKFLTHPDRCLPVMGGQIGGSGAQGICYNEDGLPERYRGNLFFCDWGLQRVDRFVIEKSGATFKIKTREPFITKGEYADFHPFSLAVSGDGASLYLVDWAFSGWLADGPKTGRLYRLWYDGPDKVTPAPRPMGNDLATRIKALSNPSHAVRMESQRIVARYGEKALPELQMLLQSPDDGPAALHALWAFENVRTPEADRLRQHAIKSLSVELKLQAARLAGIRREKFGVFRLGDLLNDADKAVRREAAIAIGRFGTLDQIEVPSGSRGPSNRPTGALLSAAVKETDPFVAWSVRRALRVRNDWKNRAFHSLTSFAKDDAGYANVLMIFDELWTPEAVQFLTSLLTPNGDGKSPALSPSRRAEVVKTLAGLYRKYPAWNGQWFGTNPLAGQLPRKTEAWDKGAMGEILVVLNSASGDVDAAVRREAIAGLVVAGRDALPTLRERLGRETDEKNLGAVVTALGALSDVPSATTLGAMARDDKRPMELRTAALDALGLIPGPQSLNARLMLAFDKATPPALLARALPSLAQAGALPANDLAGFLKSESVEVRVAAVQALATRAPLPPPVKKTLLEHFDDPAPEVRKAVVLAAVPLKLRNSVPRLLELTKDEALRTEATMALAGLPDPVALPVYLAALDDRSPDLRRAAESALLAVRDLVAGELETKARAGKLSTTSALAIERVLTRFTPVRDWRVIGPFPRTTAQVFVGEKSIDFGRVHAGAEGRSIRWKAAPADPKTGRVVIDDFKGGAGDRGGFGYDTNGSPDLCAFGYAEINSDADRPALLLVGSSGSVTVTVNEEVVHNYGNFAGRAYAPDSDLVRVNLKKGVNRVLVKTRQGIGTWSFGVRVSEPSETLFATKPGAVSLDSLREYALKNDGDAAKGKAIFFDPRGIGCVKCHAAGGQGTANVGPDLTGLALKYDRADIVRSVLEPSARLATGYQPALVATTDGQVFTGLVRGETDTYVDLIDADAKTTRVMKAAIDERRVGDVSIMPTGLVDTLKPAEFADLIAYLLSLKAAPATAGR